MHERGDSVAECSTRLREYARSARRVHLKTRTTAWGSGLLRQEAKPIRLCCSRVSAMRDVAQRADMLSCWRLRVARRRAR